MSINEEIRQVELKTAFLAGYMACQAKKDVDEAIKIFMDIINSDEKKQLSEEKLWESSRD